MVRMSSCDTDLLIFPEMMYEAVKCIVLIMLGGAGGWRPTGSGSPGVARGSHAPVCSLRCLCQSPNISLTLIKVVWRGDEWCTCAPEPPKPPTSHLVLFMYLICCCSRR